MTREEAIKRLSEIRADYSCFDDDERPKYHALSMAIQALQEPVTPIAKTQQADTLIIAAALRDFAQDSERNISDRERAGELRGQVLAYGASMCQPVTPTVSEDCISRDYMLKLQRELHGWMPNDKNHELWQKIKDAPPVTPTERTGWIPVSEGLPKEKQEVYATVYFTAGDTGRAYGHIDGFGNWHFYSTVEGTLNSGYEVTAWLPLPEPYKGGDTD